VGPCTAGRLGRTRPQAPRSPAGEPPSSVARRCRTRCGTMWRTPASPSCWSERVQAPRAAPCRSQASGCSARDTACLRRSRRAARPRTKAEPQRSTLMELPGSSSTRRPRAGGVSTKLEQVHARSGPRGKVETANRETLGASTGVLVRGDRLPLTHLTPPRSSPPTHRVAPHRSRPPQARPHRLRARDHTRARVRWLPRDRGGRWVAAFGNRVQYFRGASLVERGTRGGLVCAAAADDVALAERERVGASAARGEQRRADETV
jgi:hypothetical protein